MTYCPPSYDTTKTDYVAGDFIEVESFVFECQPYPYEEYCNVAELDEDVDDGVEELWNNAWRAVRECYTTETPTEMPTTEAPTESPTE